MDPRRARHTPITLLWEEQVSRQKKKATQTSLVRCTDPNSHHIYASIVLEFTFRKSSFVLPVEIFNQCTYDCVLPALLVLRSVPSDRFCVLLAVAGIFVVARCRCFDVLYEHFVHAVPFPSPIAMIFLDTIFFSSVKHSEWHRKWKNEKCMLILFNQAFELWRIAVIFCLLFSFITYLLTSVASYSPRRVIASFTIRIRASRLIVYDFQPVRFSFSRYSCRSSIHVLRVLSRWMPIFVHHLHMYGWLWRSRPISVSLHNSYSSLFLLRLFFSKYCLAPTSSLQYCFDWFYSNTLSMTNVQLVSCCFSC